MRKHPVRKFLGLTVLYAALIVGIFVIQFKTESVINKNIGAMHVTLTQSETEEHQLQLRNQFSISYKGFNFYSNENCPAILYSTNKKESSALILKSFDEINNQTAILTFTDDSTLSFTQIEDSDVLIIAANPSVEGSIISINYKIANTITVDNLSDNRLQFYVKETLFALTSEEITEDKIYLSHSDIAATYAPYDPDKTFSLAMTAELPLADETIFNANVKELRANLVAKFSSTLSTGSTEPLTESQIITYVAEMAANGRYNEALDAIPTSFKKGNKRTYLSAPYFNNLTTLNSSLVVQIQKYESMISAAIQNSNLDIFTISELDKYILIEKNNPLISQLLSIPKTMEEFSPTLYQAAGIINTYTKLYESNKGLAAYLEEVIPPCIEAITDCCSISEEVLVISENEEVTDTAILVSVGKALISIGKLQNQENYLKTGYLFVNQSLSTTQNISLDLLTELYPILVTDNTYYPHIQILGYYGTKAVWAWTCAQDITYEITADNVVNINIRFPQDRTHYLIINNVPTFHSQIEIQKQMFRTDARFETYNSSGYVYESNTETLFLKSRHKSETELIRLFCDPVSNFKSLR